MENIQRKNNVGREDNIQEWDSVNGEGIVTGLVVLKLRY